MSRRIPVQFRKRGYYIVRLKPKETVDLTNTADYESEYAIVKRDQNAVRVYQGGNIGKNALRNGTNLQNLTVENIESGPFKQVEEVLQAFRLKTSKSTGEKLSHGVQLAREVMAVPENRASVELNFQLAQKLSRAVVETTVTHEIDPQKEIVDIDKILCCLRTGGMYVGKKSFLHFTYIFFAAVIAAAGLWTNSGPSVVASMLVSSMMEPINGMRTVFSNVKSSVKPQVRFAYHLLTLMVDMCICIAVGALAGAFSMTERDDGWDPKNGTQVKFTNLEYLSDNNVNDTRRDILDELETILLPTEMSGRAKSMGLVVAIVVAGASAFALYFADRADNKSALVGIGISASLLPPMVNAGMLWAISRYNKINIDGVNLADMGWISFALTWINVGVILFIWAVMSKILPNEKQKKMPVVAGKRVVEMVPATGYGEKTRLLF
jgi:hypothetical protein